MIDVGLVRAVGTYLVERNRIYRLNRENLLKLAEVRYKKQVKRAYEFVPFYKNLYKNIDTEKLREFKDFKKLPPVKKDHLRGLPKHQITPRGSKNLLPVSTSGTTGRPLTVYVSFREIIHGLLGYLRGLDSHNINWLKSKIALVIDLREDSAETGYIKKGLLSNLPVMFENILLLNTNGEPKEILKKLEVFQPDFLGGYTGMLSHLALLQEKGFGRISPEKVASMGSCLDRKLREFIEKAFNADVFEVYGSTESGPVAFECEFGNLHINEDMVYLETLGEKTGRVRVTKLYGEGTPILRYDGMNDIVKLNEKNCGCGIEGKVIEKIYGRENLSIFRRDGGVLTDSVFAKIFSPLIYKLKTTKVKATKVIQHSLDKIEVKVIIDEKEDDVDEEEILSEIEDNLKRILGDVEINIKKVKRLSKRRPMVTSRVNRNEFSRLFYL